MKNILLLRCAGFTLCLLSFLCQSADFKLFVLGGQSNMNGFGYTKDLPQHLNQSIDGVYIFQGRPDADDAPIAGQGKWEVVQPGHGIGFSSNGKVNKHTLRFGVELSFAHKLRTLYPDDNIAIIKYARSGSSIAIEAAGKFGAWDPDYKGKSGVNQYDHFLNTLINARSDMDIDADGVPDTLIPMGIIWMQGESDAAYSESIAKAYYGNLKRLMDLFRASLLVDDLPVVMGKISDSWDNKEGKVWPHGELVQYAQEKFAKQDSNAAIIRATRYYQYSDTWHYTSAGYIDLGEKFADAVFELNKDKVK
ncbi:MAG: hypothetical protein JKY14_12940 [Paraglaciecola sp.]|nr:hypothetical protein [Paraglaciecola sp.]